MPAGARVLDLGNRVLLPGLIDTHTHILLQGDPTAVEYDEQILKEYPAHRVARAVRALKIGLEHGFTTMRDLETEGAGYDDVALRDAVNEGVVPGPRLKVVGPALSTTGSYPIQHYRPDWKFPFRRHGLRRRRRLPPGRPRAALLRHRLGQGLREYRGPAPDGRRLHRLPSQLDEGGARGRRLGGPRPRRARGRPRPVRHGRANRTRGRRRLDRARRFDPPRGGRRDGAPRHLPRSDPPRGRLRGRPAGRGRLRRLRADREVACEVLRQLPQGGRQDRVRHRRGRLPLDRAQPGARSSRSRSGSA